MSRRSKTGFFRVLVSALLVLSLVSCSLPALATAFDEAGAKRPKSEGWLSYLMQWLHQTWLSVPGYSLKSDPKTPPVPAGDAEDVVDPEDEGDGTPPGEGEGGPVMDPNG